jgi:glycosyltransferase involved in cell wall biosynthesis
MRDSLTPLNSVAPDFLRGCARPPLITIAIPAYNRPALLAETLASLAAQHTCDDFEVIVSDDGGLPETREAIERSALPNVRLYVNRPGLGPVGNWNHGLRLAAGRWVTILHEDDTVYPWFLATVLPHLQPGVSAVSVRCVQAEVPPPLPTATSSPAGRTYAPGWFLKSSTTPFPGLVFPRELALRLGGFDAAEAGVADYAFWYTLACSGRLETLPTPAAFYRVNAGQWTERAWPAMLRRSHLLRLRIAREQFRDRPGLGRWLARYYTGRMARSYARRFTQKPAALARALALRRIPFSWLPSGWVWAFLQRTVQAARPH